MKQRIVRRAGIMAALALTVTLIAAVPAYAGVTVFKPKASGCIQEGLKVGVKHTGSGAKNFSVKIVNKRNGKTVFSRKGKATTAWKKWVYNVPFTMPYEKKYRVTYNGASGKQVYNISRFACE